MYNRVYSATAVLNREQWEFIDRVTTNLNTTKSDLVKKCIMAMYPDFPPDVNLGYFQGSGI